MWHNSTNRSGEMILMKVRRTMRNVSRREFVRVTSLLGAGAVLSACAPRVPQTEPSAPDDRPVSATPPPPTPLATAAQPTVAPPEPTSAASAPGSVETVSARPSAGSANLAVVRGTDPAAITERAIAAIGGIERFVKSGYTVVVKPNACNANRTYEYASTTNPQVVATVVRMCLGAGAKRVVVLDYPFSGSPEAAYAKSGIGDAVVEAGADLDPVSSMRFVRSPIPDGRDLKDWSFYEPVLEADLVINVPIAKHHSLTRLTLSAKNMMGVVQDRNTIHRNLHQRIADITSRVRPQLTVMDAVRILVNNGPSGGNLDDVRIMNTVLASHDLVAVDAYACSFFDVSQGEVGYIGICEDMGLGTTDLGSVKIEELSI